MYGRVLGVAVLGVGGHPVTVEAHVGRGLPTLIVTGLPGAAVQDARERVRPAVEGAELEWPLRRVVVNLAPANLRKEGPGLDLPLVMSVLAATRQVPHDRLRSFAFAGELSLKGELLTTPGILTVAIAAARAGLDGVVVPAANAVEAAQVEGLRTVGARTLAEAVAFLRGTWAPPEIDAGATEAATAAAVDLAEVRGQTQARRALEVAAAGGHNLLMVGSPGAGKTMLARRLPGLLPELDTDAAIDVTAIHSIAGLLPPGSGLVRTRPFRAPHHTISDAALVGGGSQPRPGEVTLAHHGVLFLDELPEFRRRALEVLRQPLEEGAVAIARAARTAHFPARFQLVAAMNPCPCGFAGHPRRACRCTPHAVSQYAARLSGPLRDRIDLAADLPAVPLAALTFEGSRQEGTACVRARVIEARARQAARYATVDGRVRINGALTGREIRRHAALTGAARRLVAQAADRLGLSARAHDRVLRVARTIADLEGRDEVSDAHVAEALQFRGG